MFRSRSPLGASCCSARRRPARACSRSRSSPPLLGHRFADLRETVALTPAAVAIVTIVDHDRRPRRRGRSSASSGSTRRPASRSTSPSWSTPPPSTRRTPTRCSRRSSTGRSTWQNTDGEPVITGGPTKGIDARPDRRAGEPGRRPSRARSSRRAGRPLGACRGRHRRAHQGRDRDAGRPPGPARQRTRRPVVLDRVRPDAHRSGARPTSSRAGSSTAPRSGRTATA